MRHYVDLGLPIIPLCSHDHSANTAKHIATCKQAGKVPLLKGWREHETTTKPQVASWIKEFEAMNVGLPLGSKSGYLGIDIDGDLGELMFEDLANGDVPETWEYSTGAGRRLLFTIPVGMETKKFVNPGEGDHEECSIMCEGQQTVLPPSVHHTGRIYEWTEGCSPDDIDCAQAPPWLLDLIRLDNRKQAGAYDLTKPGVEILSKPKGKEISPIVVSANTLASEFSNYQDVELDVEPPDANFEGKTAKAQEKEEKGVTEEELLSKITSGNRDNQMTRIIGSFCAKYRALGKEYIMLMSKNHNKMFCEPPLDDFAVEAKVNHFWESEEMKSSSYKNGSIQDNVKKFAPVEVAKVALNVLDKDGYTIKVDDTEPILWMTKRTEGPWQPVDTRSGQFQTHIIDPLTEEEHGGDPTWGTVRHFKDVANGLVVTLRKKGRTWRINTTDMDTQTIDNYKYIPLAGGKLLDWRTGELRPWDPESNLTYVLPVEYDPVAKAPYWEARMKEWLPDEGSRNILQEFVGYSLIPYMGFEKALVIQGEGANGKSLFLETIQGLLGYKVVDSINMRNLFSRFGQAGLVGKILNIVNEAGSDYLRGSHADDFKNLVSGGRITADVKNLTPITFNNTAKFIFASNHDIKTTDKSDGWLRRMLIVPFEQNFQNSTTPKSEIMSELRKEHAGIFNWAIEGLRRLIQQKEFSSSESASRKKAAYMRDNDIAADFFMHCLETFDIAAVDGGKIVRSGTPSKVINSLFGMWIEYRESTVQKKTDTITKHLEKKHLLTKARTTHTLYVNKTMTECWIGLRLNIRDTAFLEHIITDLSVNIPELKTYAAKQLEDIDRAAGHSGSVNVPNSVQELPDSQAK